MVLPSSEINRQKCEIYMLKFFYLYLEEEKFDNLIKILNGRMTNYVFL